MTIASIDIGTNTVLLLIAEIDLKDKKIKSILNVQQIPRIGQGLKKGKPISKEKILSLLQILNVYNLKIKSYKCEQILVTATNAFRIASNSQEIISLIKSEFGFDTKIVSGEDEALLSFMGAFSNQSNKEILMIDIGGGSTELTFGSNDKILFNKSFNIGVVSGTENFLFDDPPSQLQINNFIMEIDQVFNDLNLKLLKLTR